MTHNDPFSLGFTAIFLRFDLSAPHSVEMWRKEDSELSDTDLVTWKISTSNSRAHTHTQTNTTHTFHKNIDRGLAAQPHPVSEYVCRSPFAFHFSHTTVTRLCILLKDILKDQINYQKGKRITRGSKRRDLVMREKRRGRQTISPGQFWRHNRWRRRCARMHFSRHGIG